MRLPSWAPGRSGLAIFPYGLAMAQTLSLTPLPMLPKPERPRIQRGNCSRSAPEHFRFSARRTRLALNNGMLTAPLVGMVVDGPHTARTPRLTMRVLRSCRPAARWRGPVWFARAGGRTLTPLGASFLGHQASERKTPPGSGVPSRQRGTSAAGGRRREAGVENDSCRPRTKDFLP